MKNNEKYLKMENGRWIFVGWADMCNDFNKFIINEKSARGFIYRTYKWTDGTIEEVKYRI